MKVIHNEAVDATRSTSQKVEGSSEVAFTLTLVEFLQVWSKPVITLSKPLLWAFISLACSNPTLSNPNVHFSSALYNPGLSLVWLSKSNPDPSLSLDQLFPALTYHVV